MAIGFLLLSSLVVNFDLFLSAIEGLFNQNDDIRVTLLIYILCDIFSFEFIFFILVLPTRACTFSPDNEFHFSPFPHPGYHLLHDQYLPTSCFLQPQGSSPPVFFT
jgi:hypothetical protein